MINPIKLTIIGLSIASLIVVGWWRYAALQTSDLNQQLRLAEHQRVLQQSLGSPIRSVTLNKQLLEQLPFQLTHYQRSEQGVQLEGMGTFIPFVHGLAQPKLKQLAAAIIHIRLQRLDRNRQLHIQIELQPSVNFSAG